MANPHITSSHLNPNPSHATVHPPHVPWDNVRRSLQENPQYQQRSFVKDALSRQPEPRWNDPDMSQELRRQSAFLLKQIQMLQLEQQRLSPMVNPQLERTLLNTRTKRDLIYWRVFRINQLPPEILVNVFRFVVWSTNNPQLGVKYRLWLTWVCRRWRLAAIADLTLWNAIWFRDVPPYSRSLAWFQRAGTAPLDLRINERDPSWNNNEDQHKFTGEQMGRLLDRLFTKLSTIRMLIVVVDTWPPALVVLDKLRAMGSSGRVITMERFELHRAGTPYVWIGPGYEPDNHRRPITLFGGAPAPSLKYLCLNGIHIDWIRSPITNLTTLDLRRMALEVSPHPLRFREILKLCPNLHKLALDGAGPSWNPTDPHGLGPIQLPRLMILVMGDFSLQYAGYVLSQFSAPNVRDLTLMNLNGEDYSPFIESMTSRFREIRLLTLYTVEVNDSPQSRRVLVKFLESLPLLSYLRIAQIQRHLLEAFLEDPQRHRRRDNYTFSSPQILCAQLNVLEFQSVDIGTILAFGMGRKALNCPLRKIYVNGPWVSTITPAQQVDLRNICESLYITPLGASTPEETGIFG